MASAAFKYVPQTAVDIHGSDANNQLKNLLLKYWELLISLTYFILMFSNNALLEQLGKEL